ncbi:aldehyde dehydrogenase family protein [Nocardia sp. CA-129566]
MDLPAVPHNDTEYGLTVSSWTRGTGRAHRIARQIRCDTVDINE